MNTLLNTLGVSLLLMCTVRYVSTQGTDIREDIDLANYGVDKAALATSCPENPVDGNWYIDRQFGSQCFSRQVQCNGGVVSDTTVCPGGTMFITDGNMNCYEAGDAEAMAACDINIDCGLEAITVYVGSQAIWGQVQAPLQFGTLAANDPDVDQCQISYSTGDKQYMGVMSFDSKNNGPNSATCGATVSVAADTDGDGIHIKYSFMVKRYSDRTSLVIEQGGTNQREEVQHGAVVTREKCFMIEAQCFYNPDGTVTASYTPSSPNALDEHDDSHFRFRMVPLNCGTMVEYTAEQTVFVDEDVCFRNEITTTWHTGINLRATSCWATETADSTVTGTDKYEMEKDATFSWLCDGDTNPMYDSFKIKSFRFQKDQKVDMNHQDSYVQKIYVHCDVNACDDGDTTSEDCVQHDECTRARRQRRAPEANLMLPKLTKRQIHTKMFVVPKQPFVAIETPPKYHLFSDILSMGIFAVGCVFAVVALGLFIVLKKTTNNMKYKMLNNQ